MWWDTLGKEDLSFYTFTLNSKLIYSKYGLNAKLIGMSLILV